MLTTLVTFLATVAAATPHPVPRAALPPAAGKPASPGAKAALLIGSWAGDGFAIGADEDRATVQSGCSHGRTAAPISLDKAGGFVAHGYFNPPRSGYRLGDIAPRDRPATFSGKVSGNTLLLTVTFSGGGKASPHTLVRGAHIKFPDCSA